MDQAHLVLGIELGIRRNIYVKVMMGIILSVLWLGKSVQLCVYILPLPLTSWKNLDLKFNVYTIVIPI